MLQKYFLINRVILLSAARKIRAVLRGRLFYLAVGAAVAVCALFALASIAAPTVEMVIDSAALGGNNAAFVAITGSFFTNATMVSSALFVLWGLISKRNSSFEEMLCLYGVPRRTRNLCFRLNDVVFLSAVAGALCFVLIVPGAFLSKLTLGFKLLLLVGIMAQVILTLLCVSVIDACLGIALAALRIPGAARVRVFILAAVLSAYFWGYFNGAGALIQSPPALYQITSAMSYPLLALYPSTGISPVSGLLALGALAVAAAAFAALCGVEDPRTQSRGSIAWLRGIPFAPGVWAVLAKAAKELLRNKECTANLLCIALALVAAKALYPEIFGNAAFALAVTLPAMNFLYATAWDDEVRPLYRVRRLGVFRVFVAGILAPALVTLAETLLLALLFPVGTLAASLGFIAASLLFAGGGFYLLGTVFPLNRKHPFSTPLIIALLVLALIPTMLVLIQFAGYLGLGLGVIQAALGITGACFFILSYPLFTHKLKERSLP